MPTGIPAGPTKRSFYLGTPSCARNYPWTKQRAARKSKKTGKRGKAFQTMDLGRNPKRQKEL